MLLRGIDADAADAPAQLAHVCNLVQTTRTNAGGMVFTSAASDSSGLAALHAAKLCVAGLRTLHAHQTRHIAALQQPLNAPHTSVSCQQAQTIAATLVVLLSPGSWPAVASPQQAGSAQQGAVHSPTRTAALYVAAHGGFEALASLLMVALPAVDTGQSGRAQPSAVEHLTAALVAAWPSSASSFECRLAWQLLSVPNLFQRAPQLAAAAQQMEKAVLPSLSIPAVQLQAELAAASTALHFHRSNEAVGAGVAHCALTLHSNLLHMLALAASAPWPAQHAQSFVHASRVLMALTPPRTREQLAHKSARALSDSQHGRFQLPRSACAAHGAHSAASSGVSDEAFAGASWYLPQLPALRLAPGSPSRAQQLSHDPGGRAPMEAEDSNAGAPARHQAADDEVIEFAAPLVNPKLLRSLAAAMLSDPAADAAGLQEVLHRASELCLWIFMLVALCSTDDAARQQLEVAWTAHALPVVRLLWQSALQPAFVLGADDAWSEGPLMGVSKWVLPLTVLCSLYADFVATAPDDVLFSEQVCSCTCSVVCCVASAAHFADAQRWRSTQSRHCLVYVLTSFMLRLLSVADQRQHRCTCAQMMHTCQASGINASKRQGPNGSRACRHQSLWESWAG